MKVNFKILDGLRGIAATYVVVNHARGLLYITGSEYAKIKPVEEWSLATKIYYGLLQSTTLGREFVVLFFILSGFSIAYSLQQKGELLGFYKRRLIRLYPPYILALGWAALAAGFAQYVLPHKAQDVQSVFGSWQSVASNLVYIPSGSFIGQFWSLSLEVIFYLLVPFFILNRRAYYLGSVALYLLSIGLNWRTEAGHTIVTGYFLDYNIYFAAGIWFFHNYSRAERFLTVRNPVRFYALLSVLFAAMVAFKLKLGDVNKVSQAIALVFAALLTVHFLRNQVTNKLLAWLGNISYTTYISHLASIYVLQYLFVKVGLTDSLTITNPYLWMLGVPFSLGVSHLLYFVAEKPSKKWLSQLRKQKRPVPASPVSETKVITGVEVHSEELKSR